MQPNCLPKRLHQFCLPPAMNESLCCSASLPAFGVVSVVDFGHFRRHAAISRCCFNLHFPDDTWRGSPFHILICHLCIFFDEMAVKVFDSFLKWGCLFSYCWVLRVLCIFLCKQSLSVMPFANVFSQTVACLLTLLTLPVTQQTFLILILSPTHMSLEQKFDVISRWRLVSALGFPEKRGQPSCGRLLTSRIVG